MATVSAHLRELASDPPEEGLLPVLPALSGLLPGGGLRRGYVVAVERPGLLCVTLAAGASAAGGWCAVVGIPQFGVLAATDVGLDMGRLLLVPDPGPRWPQVVAALLEGCELVLLRPPARPSAQVTRRLAAHVRRSGGALVVTGDWAGANLWLRSAQSQWVGIGAGHGRLRGRRVQVVTGGRGSGARHRSQWWWLPSSNGSVVAAAQDTAEASEPSAAAGWDGAGRDGAGRDGAGWDGAGWGDRSAAGEAELAASGQG